MELLKLDQINVQFGGLKAIEALSLEVCEGSITGLIGPNGAGKTTALNVISGTIMPTHGKVFYEGQEITGKPPYRLVQSGLVRTFQLTNIFPNLTVAENLMVGAHIYTRPGRELFAHLIGRQDLATRQVQQTISEILDFIRLMDYTNVSARQLPYGQQRLLELGIALAARPRLLLLDEPAAGMNAEETRLLGRLLHAIREKKIAILLIEHNMRLITSVCDHVYVLVQGKNVTNGRPQEVLQDERVIEAYLGRKHHA